MTEINWKIVYIVLFIIWFLVRLVFVGKTKGETTTKKIRPQLETLLVALNFIGMMILPLLVACTSVLDGFTMHLPFALKASAAVISFINTVLFYKIHKDLGKNWSPILEIKENHALIQDGVYKYVRHPMYSHLWLWVFTQGIILDNSIVLLFGILAWGILYFIRVPREEEMLEVEFGQQYRDYIMRTGRVFPKIG